MKFYLEYDPTREIAGSDHPILALFGGKDTQVPAGANIQVLEELRQNHNGKNIEMITFGDANHLFQKAETGSPWEYGQLDKEFVGGFREKIAGWIREQVNE